MGLFVSSFIIILAVAVSDILARLVPKISSNYINIFIGVVVSFIPALQSRVLAFDSEVFMVLILAPLLFFEGQRTPMQMVGKRVNTIIGTAVILAILSAILATIILKVSFTISLPLALAMVAISTPTDATALESVTAGRQFRDSVKTPLKMEALFNDATGLILLQAGLIWLSTGQLNVWQDLGQLVISAGGGVVFGGVLAIILMLFRQWLVHSSLNVISSQTLIYVVSPFVIYVLAEEIGVSGIIAVVTAGLVSNSEATRSRFSSPAQMHLGVVITNFATTVLNSAVFVILGISLGRIGREHFQMITGSLTWLLMGLVIYLVLLVCRFIYGKATIGDKSRQTAVLFALGGVHGTVTMAMTFSVMSDFSTHTFNLIVLVETVVIILSMLVPTIVFHWLLPVDWDDHRRAYYVQRLRQRAVEAGIKHVKKMVLSDLVKDIVIYDLRDQVRANSIHNFWEQWRNVTLHRDVLTSIQSVEQRRALMQAFDKEREYLYHVAKKHLVKSEYVYEVYNEILLAESLVLDPDSQMI